MRYRIEQHFVAICLAFSGLCFGAGLILQRGAKAAAQIGGAR